MIRVDNTSPEGGSDQSRPRRHSAATVFIDVVGYSRLMGADEDGTHKRWMSLRADVIEPRVASCGGDVIKSTGDGLLLEFEQPVDAIRFALDTQLHLAEASAGASESLQLRMSANVGDVIAERDDIYGDGVNIAARLQEFAGAGGIVISGAIHDRVKDDVHYHAADLGFLTLKNIERRVRAFKISHQQLRPPTVSVAHALKPSVAVLPLQMLGLEAKDAYLAQGIVHDIVASLAGIRELFVVSSTSTLGFSDPTIDPAAICHRLGVRYLVTGTLTRQGELLRMRVQLIDVDTRSMLWTNQYEASIAQLFDVQEKIATSIAYALLPHIHISELQRAERKVPQSMNAYDLVLQGMYRLYRLGHDDMIAARSLFERALEYDPHYAAAYALMAKWYILHIGEGHSTDFKADSAEALRLASRALEFEPSDPVALAIFGHINSFLFAAYDRALDAFDRAIWGTPNSAIAWSLSASTYCYLGDGPRAVARASYGVSLSPLDPYAYFYQSALTNAHYTNETFDEAVHWGTKVMAAAPRFAANLRLLAASLVAAGSIERAREVGAAHMRIDPSFSVEKYCSWYPIKQPDRLALLAERLIEAGLPR
ncbi:adenylate cyclase [Bradyrhizobium sp. USDA 326]|uniref:adenylate/guanylate cyclase domain-containing protein n=1 Tax=unclassified Bradyrhizobium TaxID=2631580 RepID=UPI003516B3AB